MINIQTGRICFDNGLAITPYTVINDISDFIDMKNDKILENGQWKTFLIRKITLSGHTVALSLSFENDRIRFLHISHVPCSSLWNNYSSARESYIKAKNDKLLEELLGNALSKRFSWGIVESLFDSKTGDAVIIIRYD